MFYNQRLKAANIDRIGQPMLDGNTGRIVENTIVIAPLTFLGINPDNLAASIVHYSEYHADSTLIPLGKNAVVQLHNSLEKLIDLHMTKYVHDLDDMAGG